MPEAPARSAAIAQLVEHVIRNDGVTGSNPVCGTIVLNLKQVGTVAKRALAPSKSAAVRRRCTPGRCCSVLRRRAEHWRTAWLRNSARGSNNPLRWRALLGQLTEQNPDWGVHDCPALPSANGSIFWPIANSGKDFRMSKLVVAFAFFCTGLSLASAQSGRLGTPQEQQACTRDASRYCRQQLGDDASVQQCLRQHRHRLSSACQKVFQSHGQ